jgi:3-oxoacyl-[acyl-carrier protein] reductase
MTYPKSLHGKVALVIGGSGAIGAATSRMLADAGATVAITHLPREQSALAASGIRTFGSCGRCRRSSASLP